MRLPTQTDIGAPLGATLAHVATSYRNRELVTTGGPCRASQQTAAMLLVAERGGHHSVVLDRQLARQVAEFPKQVGLEFWCPFIVTPTIALLGREKLRRRLQGELFHPPMKRPSQLKLRSTTWCKTPVTACPGRSTVTEMKTNNHPNATQRA